MMGAMRVFYLTTEFLFPPASGGRVRSLAQLRLLASLPEVSTVVVQGRGQAQTLNAA